MLYEALCVKHGDAQKLLPRLSRRMRVTLGPFVACTRHQQVQDWGRYSILYQLVIQSAFMREHCLYIEKLTSYDNLPPLLGSNRVQETPPLFPPGKRRTFWTISRHTDPLKYGTH